jgi:type I restriction enzyme S subunit
LSIVTPRKGYKSALVLFGKKIEIPEEWEFQKIKECCNILDSKRIPINSEERRKIHGNIPYYGANGIQGYVNDHIFNEELILLAEDGGYFEEYKTRPIAQYVIGKSWVNNHAHVLNSKKNILLKWIFYSLVHKNITPYINGSTRTKLNQSDLQQISILIPPLNEQKKIVIILSNMDSLIESTNKVIDNIKSLKTGLMQKLLTRGIDHKKFKDIIIYPKYLSTKIPEKWNVKYLSEITQKIADRDHTTPIYVQKGMPIISPKDIDNNLILKLDKIKYITKEAHKKNYSKTDLKPTDIIFSRIGARLGKAILVNKKFYNFSILHSLCQIRPNDLVLPEYLLHFLRGNFMQKRIWINVQSIGVPDLGLNEIGNLPIFLPPLPEQQKIASILSHIDTQITSQKQYKEKLEKLKRSLMQKLLTGEVRIKV